MTIRKIQFFLDSLKLTKFPNTIVTKELQTIMTFKEFQNNNTNRLADAVTDRDQIIIRVCEIECFCLFA